MSWKNLLKTICLLLSLSPCAFAQSVKPQDEQQQRPKQLAQAAHEALGARNYEAAVNSFQQLIAAKPDWPRAYYYLGLAYYRWNHYDEALAAYEQASRVEPRELAARYGLGVTYLALKNYPLALAQYHWLKEQPNKGAEFALSLADAFPPEVAAQYQLPALPVVYVENSNDQAAGQNPGGGVSAAERQSVHEMGRNGVTRPTITYKEKAKYTEIARINKMQGTVVLSLVFTMDGHLTNIRVIRALPDGLTRTAIEAAQKIRFQPATKDGQPVNVRGNLEFTFNLY
jgi:TonB family protein